MTLTFYEIEGLLKGKQYTTLITGLFRDEDHNAFDISLNADRALRFIREANDPTPEDLEHLIQLLRPARSSRYGDLRGYLEGGPSDGLPYLNRTKILKGAFDKIKVDIESFNNRMEVDSNRTKRVCACKVIQGQYTGTTQFFKEVLNDKFGFYFNLNELTERNSNKGIDMWLVSRLIQCCDEDAFFYSHVLVIACFQELSCWLKGRKADDNRVVEAWNEHQRNPDFWNGVLQRIEKLEKTSPVQILVLKERVANELWDELDEVRVLGTLPSENWFIMIFDDANPLCVTGRQFYSPMDKIAEALVITARPNFTYLYVVDTISTDNGLMRYAPPLITLEVFDIWDDCNDDQVPIIRMLSLNFLASFGRVGIRSVSGLLKANCGKKKKGLLNFFKNIFGDPNDTNACLAAVNCLTNLHLKVAKSHFHKWFVCEAVPQGGTHLKIAHCSEPLMAQASCEFFRGRRSSAFASLVSSVMVFDVDYGKAGEGLAALLLVILLDSLQASVILSR